MSLLLNNMTQPNDNSFYVTLTSQKTQEFPDNSPTQFQYRLPQSLWLPGKWKVGLASVFLPGPVRGSKSTSGKAKFYTNFIGSYVKLQRFGSL